VERRKRKAHLVATLPFDARVETTYSILRPEVLETFYYLYQATGDQQWRDWGWQVFRALRGYLRSPDGAYFSAEDVMHARPLGSWVRESKRMESFWFGETLKYLYLLFSDDAPQLLPLDQWVFTTEAHPMPVWQPPARSAASNSGGGGSSSSGKSVRGQRPQHHRQEGEQHVA